MKSSEKPMFPQWPASYEEAGLCHPDGTALIGRVTYASGERREFTDPEAYLQTIREELPYRDTTGFLVAAKSDGLRFRLAAKTWPASLGSMWSPFDPERRPGRAESGGRPPTELRRGR